MADNTRDALDPVVNLASLPMQTFSRGSDYECIESPVAERIGLSQLGAAYMEVPPGKSSCPFHVHHVEEEMFIILEGNGAYRYGESTYDVGAGDVLAAPCGGPEYAHKLTNTGTGPLKYLAISTKSSTDICEYPDSGKFAVRTRVDERRFGFIGREEDACEYWDGEPGA